MTTESYFTPELHLKDVIIATLTRRALLASRRLDRVDQRDKVLQMERRAGNP
jgi:hypothetical protein